MDSLDSTSMFYSAVPMKTRNFRCFYFLEIGSNPIPVWSKDSFPKNPEYIQHWSHFGELETFFAYRAKGSTAQIWADGEAVHFCFPRLTEPTYCASGKTLEDGQGIGLTEGMMDSVLRRELGMMQCQGISQFSDTLFSQVLDSLSSRDSSGGDRCDYVDIRDGALESCGYGIARMNQTIRYYHDPGIPSLPDSLYEQCGL